MENLEDVNEKIEIIRGDISVSFSEFEKLLKGYKFEKIFHLACHPRSLSLSNPYRDLEVNVKGTLNVLELARKDNCKVVFTSNSGIYGNPQYLPIDEKHPNNPTTPYDTNKLTAEYYMKIYHNIYKMPIAICRLATVYGERQRAKPDWKPVIAEFVQKVLRDETPAIQWDGKQTRDLIYVKDVVQGLTKASDSETKDEIFILGTNVETSINEIYNVICKILEKRIEPKREGKLEGDIRQMRYSYAKANDFFGFQPKYTIENGIGYYINWFQGLEKGTISLGRR
jgi:UDP-glucose 4-epimerase